MAAPKKVATNVLISPVKALEVGAKVGRATLSKTPKAASSTTPDI